MARIIKFRGMSKADDSWIFGDLIQSSENGGAGIWPTDSDNQSGIVEVYPETVGQYTGLRDRNGNEIYEGDIVRQSWEATIVDVYDDAWDATGTQTGTVVIRTQGVCISPCVTENHTNGDKVITKNKRISGYRCEIIGNKHDDPSIIESICNE